jgi:hypothetical protein
LLIVILKRLHKVKKNIVDAKLLFYGKKCNFAKTYFRMFKTQYQNIFSKSRLNRIILNKIIGEIEAQPADFQTVFELIFSDDKTISWHAAWAVEKFSEQHAYMFDNVMKIRIIQLCCTSTHGSLLRGCFSILLNVKLPTPVSVDFLNKCFENMESKNTDVAVKVLSLKLLYEITKIEPDLKTELRAVLETLDYQSYTTGFKTAAKNIHQSIAVS